MKQPSISINPDIKTSLIDILQMHKKYSAPNPQNNINDLVNFILGSAVDGFNRSGSWEHEFVQKMGLIPNEQY
jgi:hypothetical protein